VGEDKTMLIVNCLFRAGGAAVLMTNDKRSSKYELVHAERTHAAAKDEAFTCMGNTQDALGNKGVFLERALLHVAADAMRANITRLAPHVLPLSQQARFVWNALQRRLAKARSSKARPAAFLPDFSTAFAHFCVHTGGRGVLDGLEKQLGLAPAAMAPSRATLARYGNTSSSSIWYTLAGIEASPGGVAAGDQVWQVAFGSGFKCNSAVWRALRTNRVPHPAWDAGLDAAEGFLEEEGLVGDGSATAQAA